MTPAARRVFVGVGELLWDMLPAGKQVGGAPANFAYHAHALGAEAHVASCVGNDDAGRELTARIASRGMNCGSIAVDLDHPTGTVDVKLDGSGKPVYAILENVAWDYIPSSPALLDLARRADAVCYGTLCQRAPVSRKTIKAFIEAAAPGCLRVFDVNIRQSFYSEGIIRDMLRLSNVVKISDEELPVIAGLLKIGGDDIGMLCRLLEWHDLRMVALTRGARGSILVSRDGIFEHPGVPVQVDDTVGAGDAFAAAMAMGLLCGLDGDRINDIANRLAAHVCSHAGAMPAIPDAFQGVFA